MKNFRADKKLKRKRAWKRWRKTKNILDNWIKEERNRVKAGLPHRKPPVAYSVPKKHTTKEQRIAYEIKKKKVGEALKAWKEKKPVVKLKWYQTLWLKILNLLKIRKK